MMIATGANRAPRKEFSMKSRLAIAAIAAASISTFAFAQADSGPCPMTGGAGMGPGMMGGQGMSPGMMGGHGMMGGQGMGPGMMGGRGMMGGQGMGPGMMGGHGMMGGQGMGPGMMGGRGMMGGHGMMGGGMMGGYGPGALAALKLTPEQRAKMTEVQRDIERKHWGLMGSMRELGWKAQDAAGAAQFDEAAMRKNYEAMAAIRKEMFEAGLDARKRLESVLTKEQREQLRRATQAGGPSPG
jgi:Spy/CpxP family protein refolding chaperone